MNFFDSLVHATPDGIWLGGTRYNASADRLLVEFAHARVYRACLVSIADYGSNEFVLKLSRNHPDKFVPIGGFNPTSVRSVQMVERAIKDLARQGFAGLKLHPRLNEYHPLDDRCVAAIQSAGAHGLVVFLDTLFRQRSTITENAADMIDKIVHMCAKTRILLMHSTGSSMLDLFEMARMHDNMYLDLSFVLMRYAGSSLDLDMEFLCQNLDRKLTVGSDFPEYTPSDALTRIRYIMRNLDEEKQANILYRNLEGFFPPVIAS